MFFFDFVSLISFIGAAILLNLTPGADVLFICGQSVKGGKNYGIWASLGISTGHVVYVIGSALGIAEIFRISPTLFIMVKIVGVGYLLYLAYKSFTAPEVVLEVKEYLSSKSLVKVYRQGIATTLLNPKVGLFFLTFLPQFVNPARGDISFQLFILGGIFIFSGTCINMGYALFFSKIRSQFIKSSFIQKYLNKITSAIFGGLALKLLWTE